VASYQDLSNVADLCESMVSVGLEDAGLYEDVDSLINQVSFKLLSTMQPNEIVDPIVTSVMDINVLRDGLSDMYMAASERS